MCVDEHIDESDGASPLRGFGETTSTNFRVGIRARNGALKGSELAPRILRDCHWGSINILRYHRPCIADCIDKVAART